MTTPRTVTLTDDVKQEAPPAFLVFSCKTDDADYMIFSDAVEAAHYASEQQDMSDDPEEHWPIYALWAADLNKHR